MTRNNQDDNNGSTMIDLKMFKIIGLYHILWPAESGGLRDRSRSALMAVLWLTFGLRFVNAVRLYLAYSDILQLLEIAVLLVNGLICMFKGYTVVVNANEMFIALDAATYGFTVCGRRNPCELRSCQTTLSTWTRTYVTVSYGTLVLWIAAPWFLDTNNGHSFAVWILLNLMEILIYVSNVLCWLWFDCYFVTMCFVLGAQFDTVSASYKTLGHGTRNSPYPLLSHSSADIREQQDGETTADSYDQLIDHVIDNQNIIEKHDEFFDISRPMVLIQITIGSSITITLIILTTLAYMMGWPIVSVPVMKFFFGFVSLTFQLYIYCYALNRLGTSKDLVYIGIYGSNWTAMSLEFKKMLLLAMSMNSAHKRILKISPESIINLEMFAKVMNMSYSIVSVLLKTKRITEI